MANQTYVNELPANAIQCNGPLMFDMNRYITPDGRLFHIHETSGRIKEINISKQNQWAWSNAQQKLPDGTTQKMLSINGFYECKNGRCVPSALIAYYFIEKINPEGMRAIIVDQGKPLHANNLRWGTRADQDARRLSQIRSKIKPENIYKDAGDINIEEYSNLPNTNYYVKNDGTRVFKWTSTDKYHEISMRNGSDGYKNINLYIDGNQVNFRMNRLMAVIHHKLDLNDPTLVVDHINGDILDNSPGNLQAVSMQENTRKGESACPILKINSSNMTIIEEIRCIREYVENNPTHLLKTLRRVKNTGELYNDFIWLDKNLEGTLFTRTNEIITLSPWNTDSIIKYVRTNIQQLYRDGKIVEDIVPITDAGKIVHTPQIIAMINEFDPRGLGDEEALGRINSTIHGHMSCCRLISVHGNCANAQIVICLKTLLLFTRSRDNLNQTSRTCPLCTCNRNTNRQKFMPTDPEAGMPIYSYYPAGGERANGMPLAFREEYLTTYDGIIGDGSDYTPSKLKAIRPSLFGKANKSSKLWLKQAKGHPKRVLYKDLYWSFYSPIDGKMSETTPDWLLSRRLNCATMQQLCEAALTR